MQDKYHISEHFDGKIEEKADAEERRGSFLPRISRMGLPDKATTMGTCRSAPGMQARPGLQENRLPLGRGGAEGGKEGIFWTGCTGLTGWEGARFPIGCGDFNAEAEEVFSYHGFRGWDCRIKPPQWGSAAPRRGCRRGPGLQENRLPLRRGGAEGGMEGIFWTGCTGLTGWGGSAISDWLRGL